MIRRSAPELVAIHTWDLRGKAQSQDGVPRSPILIITPTSSSAVQLQEVSCGINLTVDFDEATLKSQTVTL
jgi:hypothetical protein